MLEFWCGQAQILNRCSLDRNQRASKIARAFCLNKRFVPGLYPDDEHHELWPWP